MHPLEKLVVVESRSRGGGRTYVITAVKDSVGKDKAYTGQIDAVDLDALRVDLEDWLRRKFAAGRLVELTLTEVKPP